MNKLKAISTVSKKLKERLLEYLEIPVDLQIQIAQPFSRSL
jgi:hypothetical protein